MPAPDPERSPHDVGSPLHGEARLAVSLEEVKRHFARYGLLDGQVGFLEGWFSETLSDPRIEHLAILRIDAVFHRSTMDALVALHDKVSPGGYVIVDDYGAFVPCRIAVEEFRRARGHRRSDRVDRRQRHLLAARERQSSRRGVRGCLGPPWNSSTTFARATSTWCATA